MLNLFSELWFSSSSFQFSNKKTRSRSWNQDVETNSNHIISTYRQSIRQKEKGSSTRQTDRQTGRQTSRPIDRQIRIQKPNLRSASKEVFSSVHNGYRIRCALACSTHFCLHPEDVQCTPAHAVCFEKNAYFLLWLCGHAAILQDMPDWPGPVGE